MNETQRRDEFLSLVRNRMDPALRGADYAKHFEAVRAERPDLLDNRAAPVAAVAAAGNEFDASQPRDEQGRWTSGAPSDAEVDEAKIQLKDVRDDMSQPFLTRTSRPESAKDFLRKGVTEGDDVDFGSGRRAKVLPGGDVSFTADGKEAKKMHWTALSPKQRSSVLFYKAMGAGFQRSGGSAVGTMTQPTRYTTPNR
jgi:hypothetical protein